MHEAVTLRSYFEKDRHTSLLTPVASKVVDASQSNQREGVPKLHL